MPMTSGLPTGWSLLIGEWQRSLKAENKAESTIRIYTTAVCVLGRWIVEQGEDVALTDLRRRHVEGFMAATLQRTSPGNAHTHYRSFANVLGWLLDEEEITISPMAKTKPPAVPEKPVPIVPDDLTKKVLDTCKGRDLVSRRDAAIIRLLLDTGCRLSAIAALELDDVDLDLDVVRVIDKGRCSRAVPFGARTAQALSRYLRVRAYDRWADNPALWLSDRSRGPLKSNGVKLMLRRRGQLAGLPKDVHLHAHRSRHTLAHTWREEGGDGADLMRIMGWRSRTCCAATAPAPPTNAPRQHTADSNSAIGCNSAIHADRRSDSKNDLCAGHRKVGLAVETVAHLARN